MTYSLFITAPSHIQSDVSRAYAKIAESRFECDIYVFNASHTSNTIEGTHRIESLSDLTVELRVRHEVPSFLIAQGADALTLASAYRLSSMLSDSNVAQCDMSGILVTTSRLNRGLFALAYSCDESATFGKSDMYISAGAYNYIVGNNYSLEETNG